MNMKEMTIKRIELEKEVAKFVAALDIGNNLGMHWICSENQGYKQGKYPRPPLEHHPQKYKKQHTAERIPQHIHNMVESGVVRRNLPLQREKQL